MPRDHYSDVTPGTLKHLLLDRMISSQGISSAEITAEFGNGAMGHASRFEDDNGYDVRRFPAPHLRAKRQAGRCPAIYRIVGRWTWDGEYTSYIDPDKYVDDAGNLRSRTAHARKAVGKSSPGCPR